MGHWPKEESNQDGQNLAHIWWILNKNLQPVQGFQKLHGHQAHPMGEAGEGGSEKCLRKWVMKREIEFIKSAKNVYAVFVCVCVFYFSSLHLQYL